jgi:hypothetical protein
MLVFVTTCLNLTSKYYLCKRHTQQHLKTEAVRGGRDKITRTPQVCLKTNKCFLTAEVSIRTNNLVRYIVIVTIIIIYIYGSLSPPFEVLSGFP